MRFFIAVLLWFILTALCWPLAVIILIFYPIIWLISLPFRFFGFALNAVFDIIKAILLLPFRLIKS